MNYFLVGNGFDLHHKFPTRYIDFLDTVKFLIENSDKDFTTVGQVLGDETLQKKDMFIGECYEKHTDVYNSTPLQVDLIEEIVLHAKDNLWFNYLCNCVSKNIQWIDFEKEILRVLEAFNELFDCEKGFYLSNNRVMFDIKDIPLDGEDWYILSQFDFFYEEMEEAYIGKSRMMYMKGKYVIEKIAGSNTYHLATDEIVATLYDSLYELASVLRDYLMSFIDNPAKRYTELKIKPRFQSLPTPNRVYSFNYTNIFEILYEICMVDHIHGNTYTNIVLGINPDEKDEIGNIDTTFLQFKKYFQRVFFKTDVPLLKQMDALRKTPRSNDITLYVIGHSLDSTDEDMIRKIFDSAKTIWVLYHSETSVKNQIKNLVEIYGKEGLDRLREEKGLQFLPQSDIQWLPANSGN